MAKDIVVINDLGIMRTSPHEPNMTDGNSGGMEAF
jgi:hypothetical protein